VAKIISRHYGVKVTVTDKAIGESTISGIMPNDNLDVLIQALEAIGYKITRANGEIIISGP
jgi:ferric-dicitrate binding protein FerR (iron transport regulator)